MRFVVGIVALCACNQTLGLHGVGERDATPIDAPFACPPLGTAPTFSPLIHEYSSQNCFGFARFSSGFAMGGCESPDFLSQPSESHDDGPLQPTNLVSTRVSEFIEPRPSPDAALLVVTHAITAGPTTEQVEQYHRDGSSWVFDEILTIFPAQTLGAIARDGGGYRVVFASSTATIDEWSYAGGWHHESTLAVGDLGLSNISYATLSEDGLRMLVVATPPGGLARYVYYTDRQTTGSGFGIATLLENVPVTATPYLAHDCARIYVSGLEAVFYAQQQ